MNVLRNSFGFSLALMTCASPLTAFAITPEQASTNALIWLSNQQDATIGTPSDGMVDSFEDYSAPGVKIPISYTYDQAVAAIAFISKNERLRAEKVLSRMQAIQTPAGSWYNSYWWTANNAAEEKRQHVGVVTWMAMAVMAYEKKYNDTRYRAMAEKALDWCIGFSKPNGGVSGGLTTWQVGADTSSNDKPEPWSSTEHNQDLYPTLLYFATVIPAKAATYNGKAAQIKSFLDNVVWNDSTKQFYGGWKNDTNLIDPNLPLDVNPWGVLALGLNGTRNYQLALDTVDNAAGTGTLQSPIYKHTLPYDGVNMMTAYDFDWRADPVSPPAGQYAADIWIEGSSFMSVAYYLRGNIAKADAIINEMIKKSDSRPAPSLGGLPYSLFGTNNSYWTMANTNCISSTGWVILAIDRFNPFKGEKINGDVTPPSTPLNVQTPSKTWNSISLTWSPSTDNIGVTGYNVYASGTDLLQSTTSTSITLTGLKEATLYNLTVRAKDAAGNLSAASANLPVTTLTNPDTTNPTQPTNLQFTGKTSTTVTLSWNASTDNVGVTGYDVLIGGVLKEETNGATSVTVKDLSPNTLYNFTVQAKDAAGNKSVVSANLAVTTNPLDTQAPTAPTGLIKNGTETSASVPLSWVASSDNVGVTGYIVYVGGNIQAETTGATSVLVDGLKASTAYSFTVKAKDAAGNLSAASNTLNVTTKPNTGDDYTQEVVKSGTNGIIAFKPLTAVTNVSVHYKLNGGGIQHFMMVLDTNTGVWEKGLTINTNDVIDYYFNYDKGGLTQTSIWFKYAGIPPSGDYTQSVSKVGNLAKISFTSSVNSTWVDVHYSINSGTLQNFRMNQSGSLWEKPNITLNAGDTMTYFFTYEKAGLGYDTPINPMFSFIAQ